MIQHHASRNPHAGLPAQVSIRQPPRATAMYSQRRRAPPSQLPRAIARRHWRHSLRGVQQPTHHMLAPPAERVQRALPGRPQVCAQLRARHRREERVELRGGIAHGRLREDVILHHRLDQRGEHLEAHITLHTGVNVREGLPARSAYVDQACADELADAAHIERKRFVTLGQMRRLLARCEGP